ncbi:hypothetical protein RDV89_14965 [Nocardioides zeae]|uniref:PucR family transcriptional regulator n=1 Tax=Nocardioides imazamoxiresistens TaxID=3231893 RepID=A0ABU3PYQ6_9ACTN|nr:hypothetical protein [Nocardioides zeae]MDT9594383.1 hypothetical protein [Nocardioides zeae]
MVDRDHGRSGDAWTDLIERTLRGAIDVTEVSVAPRAVGLEDGSATGLSVGGDELQIVVRSRGGGDDGVVMCLSRPGRPFAPDEREIAERIVGALDHMVRDGALGRPEALAPAVVADTLERVLHALDELVAASVLERLTTVARHFSRHLGAAAWWVGQNPVDGVLQRAASDVRGVQGAPAARLAEVLSVPEVTWRDERTAVLLEGGSYVAWAGDSAGMAAEMESWGGVVTLVAAGGYDLDARQWLVVLFGDRTSPDLRHAQAALSAAVQVAMGFPRSPRS